MAKRNNNFDPNGKCQKAILFARVSSKKQKEKGVSLDVQMEKITQYCQNNGLEIIKDYSIDESSTKGERKRFHEMLDIAANCKGKVAIIVNYVDRLQRNYNDTPELERLRRIGKIEIHFLNENLVIKRDSPATDLTFWNMHILMANFQVNLMIDKVKASQHKNWADGKIQGAAPIGYLNRRDEDNKAILIVDPVRGPIIKRLFLEFSAGSHTISTIWKLAKELGLYSKTKKWKGQFVSKNTVYDILTNPFYYGEMRIRGKLMPHIYDRFISKDIFDKVQKILTTNGNHNRTNVTEYAKTPYIFRGLIHCKECNCLITPETKIKKNGNRYIYLRCGHPNKICHQELVNENTIIEQLKIEILDKITLPPAIQEALRKQLLKDMSDMSSFNSVMKTRITNNLNELKIKENKLLDFYLENKLPQSTYEMKKAEIDKEIAELEATIEKYKTIDSEMKNAVAKVMSMAGNISNIFDRASVTRKNQIIKLLISECKLNGKVLEYKINAPFDRLIQASNYHDWPNIAIQHMEEFENVVV